jgi:hypothetical protein
MSVINPNRYPVDYTGTAQTNLIENEVVVLTTNNVRVFIPDSAPYFTDSIQLVDTTTGLTLNSTQWKPYYVVQAATALTPVGKTVCIAVAITDQAVSNNLSITYQTVGGDYVTGYESILPLLQTLTADTRPVTFPNVIDSPTAYLPTQHLENINDTMGWEYVINIIDQLKMTVLLGDSVKKDAVLNYIEQSLSASDAIINAQVSPTSTFGQHVTATNNPHNVTKAQIGLGNVLNYGIAVLTDITATTPPTNLYVTADVVAAAVKNAINLGMDVHIADYNNPHGVTKAQVGLGSVLNYGIASVAELTTPDQASPKYVTNVNLNSYLTTWFSNQQASINASFTSLNSSISTASVSALTAISQAQAAQATAEEALNQGTSTLEIVQAAQLIANQNAQNITNAVTTVTTYFTTYVAQATTNAYQAGYASGYSAGLAAK